MKTKAIECVIDYAERIAAFLIRQPTFAKEARAELAALEGGAGKHNDLAERITNYLTMGGLFNPEAMNVTKVRDLLIACRDALASPAPHVVTAAGDMSAAALESGAMAESPPPDVTQVEALAREIADAIYAVRSPNGQFREVDRQLSRHLADAVLPILQRAMQGITGERDQIRSTANSLVDEVTYLRSKLQPSPCIVSGHWAVDWVVLGMDDSPIAGYCLACQREGVKP